MGIGVSGDNLVQSLASRQKITDVFEKQGYEFPPLIHCDSTVSQSSVLEKGVQVMAGSVIQTGAHIGAHTIVNTKSSVDHDVSVGQGVHIGPGVTIGGDVSIGKNSYIGQSAAILNGIHIEDRVLVAAGAVVIDDIFSDSRVAGIPAAEMTK